MRNDSPTPDQQRVCGACGRNFPARGRKAYCSDACRQRGFRLRQRPPDELHLGFASRLPKTAIVYQCPECDARFLGQQRCDECGVFGLICGQSTGADEPVNATVDYLTYQGLCEPEGRGDL